jgi:hypothetical protein
MLLSWKFSIPGAVCLPSMRYAAINHRHGVEARFSQFADGKTDRTGS